MLDRRVHEMDSLVGREAEYRLEPVRPEQEGGLVEEMLVARVERFGVRRSETRPALRGETLRVCPQRQQIVQKLRIPAFEEPAMTGPPPVSAFSGTG
jgi:hypothetical protein